MPWVFGYSKSGVVEPHGVHYELTGPNNAMANQFLCLDAHTAISTQALGSERVREGLRDILLGPAQLYESLRARQHPGASASPR